MELVTVIGRGHSGTRAISHTLTASGVHMGEPLNVSGDLLPPDAMYEACRVMARHVVHLGGMRWDFSRLHTMPIDPAFTRLIEEYLGTVLSSGMPHRGWKIPETTLVYPWIVRLFPGIRYIFWIRDPRDCILGRHMTDDLSRFDIPYEATDDIMLQRATSWKYQVEIVKATPAPRRLLSVRFEDFVLNQDEALKRIGDFMGLPMAKIEVRPESVGRWRRAEEEVPEFEFLEEEIQDHGYGEGG
ncbi:MAG: hypothetical protein DRP71_15765 [Verrucomicrobia bacterium]|nr:MAG: hypothetical protein DRP71_15765 [Verrucomicrobiota bacterium]